MTSPNRSRRDSARDHVERYQASDGRDGHIWNGVPTLLLTTTGRQSGERFTTPLVYGRSGASYLVVASRGGSEVHPHWYLNLRANPKVELQVEADVFHATARTATPEEMTALWPIMTAILPRYDEYQRATQRDIPLVLIDRVEPAGQGVEPYT